MDAVVLARILFGSTLGFHIIYATLGVGIPLIVIIAEVLYAIKKDKDYALLSKRLVKGFAILLAGAIATGTIVAVLLNLLWPAYMEIVGQVIALPFQIEIYAFLIEALFMSMYLYAADRMPNWLRILSIIFVAFGALASAILITDAHSWMNTPSGFEMTVNGEVINVDPWKAFFNPSFGVTAVHVAVSAYMTVAFIIGSIAAFKLLKKNISSRERTYHRKSLTIALYVGAIMSLSTAINGHETAQMLHEYMPRKLAGAEGLFETTKYAPLSIGGFTSREEEEVLYAIEVPYALSFLAGDRFDTEVLGLNEFPEELWPPLYIHTLFNVMVGIGSLLIVLSFFAIFLRWIRKKELPGWMLALLVGAGPLAMIGIETGWCFSCIGRQPWTINDVLKTHEAATQANHVGVMLFLFLGLYFILAVATVVVLISYFKRQPLDEEMV
ncbi:cytochrome D ubiquinol oxidase subunit I [Pontibacillus halophilus JSM 076056 = DSM 19796]|uniref:Cytochrome D ubiquinol oxidase subunit I n=1 Tax=Pontibacillus halophilus JSM 076056 = DSM 19796 TaxID=1385510 RepID=A0A0A5ID90_9BACI|nr:cytochrome ubiquinol oxidase subunit I [Pontibacillus halophilus]KGX93807.1 cytochrome D ubiquinol oxidase subunit I [Pontibacillus halophilus JSM 076056 = DSM 19796]